MRYIFKAVPTEQELAEGYTGTEIYMDIDRFAKVTASVNMYKQFLASLGYTEGSISQYVEWEAALNDY